MFFPRSRPAPCSSYSRLPIQSSLCLGTHIATHTHAHKVLLWLVGNMPPANYPATATENDLNTEKCVQFFALGFFGRYKEEYLLTRPASKVLMPMGGAGGGKVEAGRRWTTICKQLLSSLKAKFSSFIYFRFLIIISSSFFLFSLCILFHVCSCLSVCNIFVRILMNLLLICVRYICRLHWPHGALVLPAPLRPHCPQICTLFFLKCATLLLLTFAVAFAKFALRC